MKRKKWSPGRIISLGFALVILVGAVLLFLPAAHKEGVDVSAIDALFTSTSAVCVTGLIAVDAGDTFNTFGIVVLGLLIQIGGLGITSIGVGFIMLSGKKIGMRQRTLVKTALNYHSLKGILGFVKAVLFTTLAFEFAGMLLSFVVFSKDYPFWEAIGISAFHSVAAFNNSGFDILGGFQNLTAYNDNVLLNLTTCFLIIFGGLGFFVICEIVQRRSFRKFSLHAKMVLTMTGILLAAGTLLLKATENISWLGAFFNSTSARTAGFSTFPLGEFSTAGLFVLIILMFIGASPGSTGGGIKTTTFFVLLSAAFAASTNKHSTVFKKQIPHTILFQAFIITFLAVCVVCTSVFFMSIAEPDVPFLHLLFETVSAFGTVGLSTGITPDLCVWSKIILIITMFIGRLGPLTIASLWIWKKETSYSYPEEAVTIG